MADRSWGLWAVPGSGTVASSLPSARAPASQRVPPKTPIKMSGTHRPPKIPAALMKRRGQPAQKMPGNYVSYRPPVEDSEESSEEEISQDARHVFNPSNQLDPYCSSISRGGHSGFRAISGRIGIRSGSPKFFGLGSGVGRKIREYLPECAALIISALKGANT